MSSLQTYERGALFLGGALLVESQSISVDVDPKLNEINTMQKGFAGVSPGSEMTKVDISEALPRAGVDYDALSAIQGVEIVELVLFAASKKWKVKGYINSLKMSLGVDKAAEYSFTFIGGPLETSGL